MLRLFLSLYLLISIGLVLINLSSNFLFAKLESNIQSDKFSDIHTLSQLTSGYAKLLANEQLTLSDLQQALPYPLLLTSPQDIGFLPQQTTELSEQKVVSLFSDDTHILLFAQISEQQLLRIGPISLTSNQGPELKYWLILLSYILLAVLIFAWSKPLWRDLTTLIGMTKQVSASQLQLSGEIPKHSVLFPLHQALMQMSSRITELMTIQKQMIHAVSHDIRTPLARMKFALAMLDSKKPEQSSLQEAKLNLGSDIADIEELIDNLLSFGRIESHNIELDKHQVDLSALITNLSAKLAPLSSSKVELEVAPNIHYFCDGHLLERAVQNLIANAQKYGHSNVLISLSKSASCLLISIEDDGDGIPKDKISQVLQPFSRLEKSRNKASGGFGLGLAIVNRIVQWHEGELKLSNSSLGGAKVEIQLPIKVN